MSSTYSQFLPLFVTPSLTNISKDGPQVITDAQFAEILKVLQEKASTQLQPTELAEVLVKTLLKKRDLLNHDNMLPVIELLLQTVGSLKTVLVLTPQQIAELLKVIS